MPSTDWAASFAADSKTAFMTPQERIQAINNYSDEIAKSLEGGKRAQRQTKAAVLSKLSKDKLYQKAKAKDIKGRSKMTKAELVKALCK